jgi:hypothetical protein
MHPRALEVRNAFVAVNRPEDWRAVLEHWYAEDLPGVHPELEVDETAECG